MPLTNPKTGDKNVMILRNHGLLVAGGDVAKAFFYYYSVLRACEVCGHCRKNRRLQR